MEKIQEYKPAIKIQDFPSKGRVSRVKGRTTGRLHHLLTDLETNIFYLLDFEDKIIDIKEHYPLLDLMDGEVDLENINLNKFKNKKTGEQYIFSTTFVVTINDTNKEKYIALSVKNESQLYRGTTLEKLEVERRYWKVKGIEWSILTNRDININRVENIKWLLLNNDSGKIENEELITNLIEDTVESNNEITLNNMISNIAKVTYINEAIILTVFKRMISNKKLITDLNIKILLEDKLMRYKVAEGGEIVGRCING